MKFLRNILIKAIYKTKKYKTCIKDYYILKFFKISLSSKIKVQYR
ncbi:hypothetical protein ELUCI_v1c04640 [Williamsoniiplasma lucivorax]|uniref:Uncharacterized protein n=1 Tax=Williamsoniiplasma lucivorax TaxID=209274 RepID=A0A2S5RFU0_9MOLU|nr:hypothetical protein ELUCI_v1c04640 [Williamsoniiplasma lucivorax]